MTSKDHSVKNLTCPKCCEIFKDPVITSCKHNICKACLQQLWENTESRECPVCKRRLSKKFYPPNMELQNKCVMFRQDRSQTAEILCSLHKEKFTLFCVEDKKLACQACKETHTNHSLRSIGEVAEKHKAELKDNLDPLKEILREFKEVQGICVQTTDEIKTQVQHTEKQIKEEFEKLHQFLRDEEAARIAALREEEEQKSQKMKEKIEKMSREISSLSDTITAIEEEMRADDISFLNNYKSMVERAQSTLQDPERVSGALINVAKHVGNLKFRVWENMKDIIQYTPVTLDPNTAHPLLILSEDLTSVRLGDETQKLPDNPDRFDKYHYVLGSEGFNSGTHCWDVDVGNNVNWEVGVITESLQRKGDIHTVGGVWGLCSWKGTYGIRSKKHPYSKLIVKQKLQRIKLQLDWDRGELSFSDPDSNTHLDTLTHSFTERVFPYFHVSCKLSLGIVPMTAYITTKVNS